MRVRRGLIGADNLGGSASVCRRVAAPLPSDYRQDADAADPERGSLRFSLRRSTNWTARDR